MILTLENLHNVLFIIVVDLNSGALIRKINV